MLKERKIKTQENLIKRLRDENRDLRDRIKKLESEAASRKTLLESAGGYREEHLLLLKHMDDARKNYIRATEEIYNEKKKYRDRFDEMMNELK